MSPAMTDTFIVGCIALLVMVAGFFGTQWAKGLKTSVESLTVSIGELNQTIAKLDKSQALQEERQTQARLDIVELQRQTCQNPDCPYRGDRRKVN